MKHINLLELQAAFFGLKSFADHTRGVHIQLQLDNTTAVAYVNNMRGSKSLELDQLANDLWGWSISREIRVSAVHIPGISNIDANEQSRNFNDKHEWALNTGAFQEITAEYPDPDPVLFCRCLFTKLASISFLCISTFQPDPAMPPENQQGQGNRHSHCPISSSASLQILNPAKNLLQHPGHQKPHPL